jgi:hypothetical protein
MVLSLAPLEDIQDRNLLVGSLMVVLERDYDHAQVHMLGTLHMRTTTNGCGT